jgi:uncharacterized protein (DUF885 family)
MFLLIAGLGAADSGSAAAAPPSSAAGSASDRLAKLAESYYQGALEANPVSATSIGDRRYDDRLDDNTPAGIEKSRVRLQAVLDEAQAIPEGELNAADQLTRIALIDYVEGLLAENGCHLEEWNVDPLNGPHLEFFNIESYQPIRTFAEAQAMVKRWRAMGPYLDQTVANWKHGLANGKVAPASAVKKVVGNVQETLARPDSEWALLNPLHTPHPDWTDAQREEFRSGLTAAVHDGVRPALERYEKFLETQDLPKARSEDKPGIMYVAGGVEAYRGLIKMHTSLALSPDEIHEIGLQEVARINAEMEQLGQKVFGISDRAAILKKLRTDKSLYFQTPDQVEAKAESALAKAKAAIPQWFGILPKADCVVTPMLEHEAKVSTIAYYRQPATDGSRPGTYYINTYAPETRPRYEAEALAYHESIPGHHLQIAIAQELKGIPEFRKHVGVTAFVEGWGLYSERLADEMGLYSSDLDRIGILSFDGWRACRLVVDTGIHAKGWTRQQAIDYMLANTALAQNNIENEVDRYIAWPGQALAYKLGQREILRLRAEAKQALGPKFDIKKFHDVVLRNGAVSLATLRHEVDAYIARGGSL